MSTPSVVVKNRARQIACDLTRVWATPREPQTRGEHSLRDGSRGCVLARCDDWSRADYAANGVRALQRRAPTPSNSTTR
jgi:hypothetical protein